jgi:methyl-accepting chemotaxis protein
MSATSEELAAQAEQLQSNIAFFRIGQTGAAMPAPVPAPVRAEVKPRPAKPRPAAAAPRASVAAGKKAASGGFALDMTAGGGDARDAEFERV